MAEEKQSTDEKIIFEKMDLKGSNSKSIATKKQDDIDGTNAKFLRNATIYFDRYSSERVSYEEIWEVADAMHKSMQNRSIAASEDTKGANLSSHLGGSVPIRANIGSPHFHRFVNQLTGQFMAVYLSKGMPFQYDPIVNTNIQGSSEEGLEDSEVWNLYAKWVLKRNGDGKSAHEFASSCYKYGCVAEMVYWEKKKIGKYEFGYPLFQQFPLRNLFLDPNGGNPEHQHCVITCTPRPASYILKMVDDGEYDAEQVMKINRTHLWDGLEGGLTQEEQESEGKDTTITPSDTGMFLEWNIFMMFPVEKSEYKDSAIPKIWWGTAIGNSVNSKAVLVRLEPNRDPDDEIPIHVTNAMPDDNNRVYHISPAQIIRSNYSTECTLIGQIVDEGTSNLLAPDIIQAGAFPNQTEFRYDGKPWICEGDPARSVKRHDGGNASQFAIQLLSFIQDSSSKALNLDKSFQGESFGARTSASEAGNIYRSSSQPILAEIRYVMQDRETWRARKIMSYGSSFAKKEVLMQITDDSGTVQMFELLGDMNRSVDIEVNIVDEFENKVVQKQNLNEKMSIIAASPVLSQRVNMEELLRQWFEVDKLPTGKLVVPPSDLDSDTIAEFENSQFAQGVSIAPSPGQNDALHIAKHKAFMVRWSGLEPEELSAAGLNPRAIEFARIHVEQHQLQMQQGQQGGASPLPEGARNETEGEAQGNALAAFQGAALGGRP